MKSVKIAALVAAGTLALAGCADSNPRVAAYINGTEIRIEQIEAASAVMARATGEPAGGFGTAITNAIIQGKIAQSVLTKSGVTVTDAQRAAEIPKIGAAALASDPTTADIARAFADYSLLQNSQTGPDALAQEAARSEIRLNPRYGTWDNSQVSIAGPGSISLQQG